MATTRVRQGTHLVPELGRRGGDSSRAQQQPSDHQGTARGQVTPEVHLREPNNNSGTKHTCNVVQPGTEGPGWTLNGAPEQWADRVRGWSG